MTHPKWCIVQPNIHEANYAASKADFANKLQIALKECFETEYWIRSAIGILPEFEDVSKYEIYVNDKDERCYCNI